MPIYFFLIFGLVFWLAVTAAEGRAGRIEEEIRLAKVCTGRDSCALVEAGCPFGCYTAINEKKADYIFQLIDSYDSRCIYGCAAMPDRAYCINGQCRAGY